MSESEQVEARVDLLVVACEGRARLLAKTLRSFLRRCAFPWHRRILALDGEDPEMVEIAKGYGFDRLLVAGERRGVFENLKAGYAASDAPFVFHLEDDWALRGRLPVAAMVRALGDYPELLQVRVSKRNYLLHRDGNLGLIDGRIHVSDRTIQSFNPHVARPADFLDFAGQVEAGRFDVGDVAGLEQRCRRQGLMLGSGLEMAYTLWLREAGRVFAVLAPGRARVVHLGGASPTARRWHGVGRAAGERPEPCAPASGRPARFLRRWSVGVRLAYRLMLDSLWRHDSRALLREVELFVLPDGRPYEGRSSRVHPPAERPDAAEPLDSSSDGAS